MELGQLGWNALTIGFAGTLLFTLVEAWGLWRQGKTIRDKESGKSVSVLWFCYFATLFAVLFIYGLANRSIAMTFNGLLALVHIPILTGLWKHKGFSTVERRAGIAFIGIIMLCAVAPFGMKGWIFLLLSFGNIGASVLQPYEIWKNKTSGAVEIRLLSVYTISTIFWVIYAYASGDWVLKIICPAFLAVLSTTVVLWFWYREPEPNS